MSATAGRRSSDEQAGEHVRPLPPADGFCATWVASERPRHAGVPADVLAVRPPSGRLAFEAVVALSDVLLGTPEPLHVMIDLRQVSELDDDAVAAMAVLDAALKQKGTRGLSIRVRTARQLEAFEPLWNHVLIG